MLQLKLRGRIVGAAALVFVVAIVAGLAYVVYSTQRQALDSADALMTSVAETEAQTIQVVLKEHSTEAKAMAQTMAAMMVNPNVGHDTYKSLFEQQLPMVPHAVGIWALLDKDAPTAADAALMSSDFGLADGYFGPSITRDLKTGASSFSKLDLSLDQGFKGWFLDPLAKGSPSLIGPYLYNDMLYTSSTAVIHDPSGKAVGVAGVDFNGGVFNDLIGKTKPFGTGWIGVINADGAWVVHSDETLLGKPVDDGTKAIVTAAASGIYHAESRVSGDTWRTMALKVDLPDFGSSWTVMLAVPEATLFAAATQQRDMLLAGAGLILALGLVAFWFIGASITRPISRLTGTMDALASGRLDVEIEGSKRRDELGAMARAVEVFRANAITVRDMSAEEHENLERRRAERVGMMQRLQKAFGRVVDAGIAGDFSRRVDDEFPDAELNALARSVNGLVETVDRGLTETGHVLSALARTDLTRRMNGDYQGAFATLAADVNAVSDKLAGVVGEIRGTSSALKVATAEILSGANDLSERTTKQAATIEETSAAMEQLAATVSENAGRAEQASLKARDVSRAAGEGGEVMQRASAAMERITQSSGKISNIIGLIDDIAFQTNLLALNASVEAARAGDAGKGFAVVAVEVRRLAQSAARASSDVKALIEQSGNEVSGGTRLVREAAAKLEAMLSAAEESSSLVGAIASASREQASSIDEVSGAVRVLDEMTQHNAALVEETNAAIEQTEAQASDLDRIVGVFTLARGAGTAEIRPRRSMAA